MEQRGRPVSVIPGQTPGPPLYKHLDRLSQHPKYPKKEKGFSEKGNWMIYGKGESENHSNPKDQCYLTWRNMLKRCYSGEKKYDNYKEQGITVCDEWLNFLTFKSWYDRNFYQIENEQMNLDKDILCHGNTLYCPEYCIFVPKRINGLFVKAKNRRGDLPIGVQRGKGCFISSCSVNGKNIKSKHKDSMSAFLRYKEIKEKHVKEIANQYKNKIPQRLYEAMMMFEVKIDD